MYVKKMSCLLCLLLMMNTFSIPCNAMEIQTVVEEIPVLGSEYFNTANVSLGISGKQASIIANVRSKTLVDQITMTVELQKKNNDSWSTVKTWKKSNENRLVSSLAKQYDLTKKGKYRVKLAGKIYKNNSCEKVTIYSSVKQY